MTTNQKKKEFSVAPEVDEKLMKDNQVSAPTRVHESSETREARALAKALDQVARLDEVPHPAKRVAQDGKDAASSRAAKVAILNDAQMADGFERKLELLDVAAAVNNNPTATEQVDDPVLRKTNYTDIETGSLPRVSAQPSVVPQTSSNIRTTTPLSASQSPGAFAAAVGTTELHRNSSFHVDMLSEVDRTTPSLVIRESSRGDAGAGRGNADANLAVANEISENANPDLQHARQSQPKTPSPINERSTILCWLGGIALASGVVLLLVFLLTGKEKAITSSSLTAVPSSSPSPLPLEKLVLSLLPEETNNAISGDPESPQAQAYQWMMEDPNLSDYSEFRIVQRFALATFYLALNGDNWSENRQWLSHDYHECQWYSRMEVTRNNVKLDEFWDDWIASNFNGNLSYFEPYLPCEGSSEQVISHLWLYNNMLQGVIPPELYLLTALKSINFDKSELEGSELSSQIGQLSNLESMTMWRSGIGGTLPTEVGVLTNVQQFELSSNNFTGPVPSQFGLLSDNLRWFLMDHNELTGSIPTEMGLLSKLDWLILWVNRLTGPLPSEIGQMSMLNDIPIEFNQLTGPLPTELGMLTLLTSFWMHENLFSGNIPSQLGLLSDLHMWQVSANELTGTIPTELFHQKLRLIYLDDNKLSGPIPSQAGLSTELRHLELRNNHLSGSIPSEIAMIDSLVILALSDNRLSGSIPAELDDLAANGNFSGVYITDNDFSGTISNEICDLGRNEEVPCPWKPFWWSVPIECGIHFDCSASFHGCGCMDDNTNTTNQSHSVITVIAADSFFNGTA